MNDYIFQIFDTISVGVAVIDDQQRIVRVNSRFFEWFGSGLKNLETRPVADARASASSDADDASNLDALRADFRGVDFYKALNLPKILDGDFCPLHFFEVQREQEKQRLQAAAKRREDREEAAKNRAEAQTEEELEEERKILRAEQEREERWKAEKRTATNSTLEVEFPDGRVEKFELTVQKITLGNTGAAFLAELKKMPKRREREQTFLSLRKAGDELTTTSENSLELSPEEQKALIQKLVERHMRNVLNFDVVEIRLLEQQRLKPFLSFGMRPEITEKELVASADGQGITGYVASSGEPYFCEDTENDFLYIPGAVERARCSITVPLLYHGSVVGVCNVESATPDAFTRADLDFLQLYANDLARAVQTLKLISLESEHTRRFCGEQIKTQFYEDADDACERALSLLDAATRLEAQNKIAPEFVEKIRRTTRSVWALRAKIADVKKDYLNPKTPPTENEDQRQIRTTLRGRRVLIVNSNREEARRVGEVFESYDCRVDVAFETKTALQLLRSQEFELVVCDLFPDGRFFDEIDPDARRNEFGVSRYHIHRKHYEVPVQGDKIDAKTRREVLRKINVERRLDGYFLRVEIDRLGLNPPPVYALSASTTDHDSTHVISDINGRYKTNDAEKENENPVALYAPTFALVVSKNDEDKAIREKQFIKMQELASALRCRDAKIAAENEE